MFRPEEIEQRKQELIKMLNQCGCSRKELAKKTGVSPQYIHKLMKKYGIKVRKVAE